jgi:hypothetical protein
MAFANATACFEEFAGWDQAIGAHTMNYSPVTANYPLNGKPAQVSTVRTEKLVFSLNYERLGNRANVAGTGTSLCRLIGEWKSGSRTSHNDGGGGNEQHVIAAKSGSFLRIVYGNKLACQDNLGPNNGD